VHVGARVAALAGPGEVLVSSMVKDLTAGSGLSFEDAGEHELKGIPGAWRIYAGSETDSHLVSIEHWPTTALSYLDVHPGFWGI